MQGEVWQAAADVRFCLLVAHACFPEERPHGFAYRSYRALPGLSDDLRSKAAGELTCRPPCPGGRALGGEAKPLGRSSALPPYLSLTLEPNTRTGSSSPSFAERFLNQN